MPMSSSFSLSFGGSLVVVCTYNNHHRRKYLYKKERTLHSHPYFMVGICEKLRLKKICIFKLIIMGSNYTWAHRSKYFRGASSSLCCVIYRFWMFIIFTSRVVEEEQKWDAWHGVKLKKKKFLYPFSFVLCCLNLFENCTKKGEFLHKYFKPKIFNAIFNEVFWVEFRRKRCNPL